MNRITIQHAGTIFHALRYGRWHDVTVEEAERFKVPPRLDFNFAEFMALNQSQIIPFGRSLNAPR